MSAENKMKKDDEKEKPTIAKTPADLQRIRLEKLMKNPEKPVVIPPRPKEKNSPHVPEFVRNVMGSSAGAGSGEFHVYRHLRRKEYARQKFIQEKAGKELLDEEYHRKIEENRKKAEELTAKKRAKRLKKKNKKKRKEEKPKTENSEDNESSDSDDEKDACNSASKEDSDKKKPEDNEGTSEPESTHNNSADGSVERKKMTEEKGV